MLTLTENLQNGSCGFKGVGNLLQHRSKPSSTSFRWNILKGDVSFPAATLSKSVLEHNQLWMTKFSEKLGFQLAPHGKTTMLPDLFNQQISSGCWGMTLATAYQVAVALSNGVKRVIMANQLVGDCNMSIISTILATDPNFEFHCLVDSATNVAQLGNYFSSKKQKIRVLLEYGPVGGRTGVRNEAQEQDVLSEIQKWKGTISLTGIEFFEGILKEDGEIREFISWCLSRVDSIVKSGIIGTDEVIITGAGTSWFDVVAVEFQKFEHGFTRVPLKKILRSGCYLIYDKGLYAKMEQRVLNMDLGRDADFAILSKPLKPAIKIWAYVHSVPEPNLAILGFGKRDAAVDSGFPVPHSHYRPDKSSSTRLGRAKENWTIFNMMDQHTFMRLQEGDDIQVGDILSFDIYHPCTTLDKWRNVLLIDDDMNVTDVLHSDF